VSGIREALVRILEALEAGDVRHAEALALAALEGAPVLDPDGRRRRCPFCSFGPDWPGKLEHHMQVAHPRLEKRAA
jgi:hypothetical protein